MYKEAADIRDMYLYKKLSVQVGSWYTGVMYRQKNKGVSAYNTENTLWTTGHYINCSLSNQKA